MSGGSGPGGGPRPVPAPDKTPTTVVAPDGEQGVEHPGTGTLGVQIFCAGLAFLFFASLIGYLWIRFQTDPWPPEGVKPLPWGMVVSTAVLAGCSAGIQWALVRIRKGDQKGLRGGLAFAFTLAFGFLIAQSINWYLWLPADILDRRTATYVPERNPYTVFFVVLTGLHALHILGGLIPLGVVMRNAFKGKYTWAFYPGVKQSAIYWHFLGVIWLILYAVLFITG